MTDEKTTVESDFKTKLATLRKAKQERDDARDLQNDQRELLVLELEERFERELGARGKEFEIVVTNDGPIVVRAGEFVLYKRFQASMGNGKEPSTEDIHKYVFPCVVYPTPDAFNALLEKRPHYGMRCANALLVLHGFKEEADRGKY